MKKISNDLSATQCCPIFNRPVARVIVFLLALCAIQALPARPAGGHVRVVNLMPSFFTAWDAGKRNTMNQRISLLKQHLFYPNEIAYNSGFYSFDDVSLAWYIKRVSSRVETIRALSLTIPDQFIRTEATFAQSFPDFNVPVTVFFLPSMGFFDGQTRDTPRGVGVFFGIDVIAKKPHRNIAVLVSHELFHLYHAQVNKDVFPTVGKAQLYAKIWREGLATYASSVLNPDASRADVLADAKLTLLSPQQISTAACAVQSKMSSTEEDDAAVLLQGARSLPGLPERIGYYLGYVVAQHLGKNQSLRELAAMKGPGLEVAVLGGMKELCSSPRS